MNDQEWRSFAVQACEAFPDLPVVEIFRVVEAARKETMKGFTQATQVALDALSAVGTSAGYGAAVD
jgi:hypothetical protein